MSYYRRPENLLDALLRWRRNVFLQSPTGGYVLVSATKLLLTLHHFDGSLRHDPTHTEHLDSIPNLFDGSGWNLFSLKSLIYPETHIMPENNQQPYAALYCKPMRASIRNMTNIESKVFLALTTYADERGVCYPGVRELAETTGLQPDEISEGLRGLQSKGFIYYLRYNQIDPVTRKMQPNAYGLNNIYFRIKLDSGIQTYMHEFLSPVFLSNPAQPDSINQNQEPESLTNSINHHHQPTPESARTREMPMQKPPEGENSGKAPDYANQPATPAAQPQPKDSENDLPPRDTGKLDSFTNPLPQIDMEAYAHEMRQLVSGLQLAKARQLVAVYGIEMCGIAVRLLAKQPFKSVDNPPGWIINKLRQGALVLEDGEEAPDETNGKSYITGEWGKYIEH
jgi:hypothetical protein